MTHITISPRIIAVEEWRDVVGFEAFYKVSRNGVIMSKSRQIIYSGKWSHRVEYMPERIVKTRLLKDGYLQTVFSIKGVKYYSLLHIVIAKAFIPNPNNYPVINHLNGLKNDNRIENLEWCTQKDNCHHYLTVLKSKKNTN